MPRSRKRDHRKSLPGDEFYDPIKRKFIKKSLHFATRNQVCSEDDFPVLDPEEPSTSTGFLRIEQENPVQEEPITTNSNSKAESGENKDYAAITDENPTYFAEGIDSSVHEQANKVKDAEIPINIIPVDEYDEMWDARTYRLFEDEEEEDEELPENDNEFDDSEEEEMSVGELRRILGAWLLTSKTRQRPSKELLHILRTADPHSNVFKGLPKHPATLYSSLKKNAPEVIYEACEEGEMAYLGVRQSLELNEIFYDPKADSIELTANVDGLPLFRTSPLKFWPTLASVQKRPIFIIALYKGKRDPKSSQLFLKRFLDEILPYLHNGIEIGNKHYQFHLVCILADAPARAFLLGMKYHTGYFSCSKCSIKGLWTAGRVCFPMLEGEDNTPPRLPEDFFKGTDQEGNVCPLSCIPSQFFNIRDSIILDSMHLIYLGIMKKLIESWISDSSAKERGESVKLWRRVISADSIRLINVRLARLAKYCPSDFQRTPREFSELAFWRAHEYRQFLLYLGYPVLHGLLPKEHLEHFLVLQAFTRILADFTKVRIQDNIEYAKRLAEYFIVLAAELFGEQWVIYNVHSLLHVPEDVFNFGCLENKSCFMFESFLYMLKKLVRSGRNPLKQAINRWFEWVSVRGPEKKKTIGFCVPHISPGYDDYVQYKRLQMENFVVRSDCLGDKCCLLNDTFIEVSFFCQSKTTGDMFIAGHKYLSVKPLYEDPADSSKVGVHCCKRLASKIQLFPVADLRLIKKIYRVPLFDAVGIDAFVCSTLLHSEH